MTEERYFYSLDHWLDVGRLAAIEHEISTGFSALEQVDAVGTFKLRGRPAGPKKLRLTQRNNVPGGVTPHHDYGDPRLWCRTEACSLLPHTWEFVRQLPFVAFGRVLILVDRMASGTPLHSDHELPGLEQQLIWIRTSVAKRFYIEAHGVRTYVVGHAVWFDTRHKHGADPAGAPTISLRVDGIFQDALHRELLKRRWG